MHFSPSKEHMKKVEYDDDHHQPELTFSNSIGTESKCNYISLAECLSREKALESSHQANGISRTDSTIDHGEFADDLATSYVPLPEFDLVREKKQFHIEKAAGEVEEPKMVVCFEVDERQIIKDIGVDEGLFLSDIDLLKEKENDMGLLTVYSNSEKYSVSNGICDFDDIPYSSPKRNPFLVDTKENNLQHSHASVALDIPRTHNSTKSTGHIINKEVKGIVHVQHDLGRDSRETHSSSNAISIVREDNIPPCSSSHDLPNQGTFKVEVSSTSAFKPLGEPMHVDGSADSSPIMQIIGPTSAGVPAMSLAIADKEIKGGTGVQQHDMIGERPSDSFYQNPFLHYSHTDASIYGPHALSDRLTYTGHTPYTGSVSLRSDSSTTSNRSFAFPILQSEWNSSPVKMAKADRRHYRKYHGWRSCFCARF